MAIVVCEANGALDENDVIEPAKQNLAGFKVPKRVVFLEELPRNTMAKVQKSMLRERYKQLLS